MSKFTRHASSTHHKHGFDTSTRVAAGYGNVAGKESPYRKLRRMAALFHLGPGESLFYKETDSSGDFAPLADIIVDFVASKSISPEEAFKVACEVAEEGARHGPALIAIGLIKAGRSDLVRQMPIEHLLTTPKQALDLLAMWRIYGNKEKRYPHALTDLIAKRFPEWDAYQLRKHFGEGLYSVKTLLKLTHPKPKDDKQSKLWKEIVLSGKNAIPAPETWEVYLSRAGKDREKRKEAWLYLLENKKLPTLATIRNLRNMVRDGIPLRQLDSYIRSLNPQYLSVFNVVKAMAVAPELTLALEDLMKRFWNQGERKLPGLTDIVIDVSGSMGSLPADGKLGSTPISRAVAVAYSLMLAAEHYRIFLTAGNDDERRHATKHVEGILGIRDLIEKTRKFQKTLGYGGIFTAQCVKWLNKNFSQPDRLIVISDSQDIDEYYSREKVDRPRRGKHMIEINIAPYKNVHVTDQAYGRIWTVIEGFADPVPYIRSVESANVA